MSLVPGADAFVRMLQLSGVKHIFGLCGDTSLPFYDALARRDHGMQHILTRATLAAAIAHDGPALVDVITQPLHEAQAPVSEWIV
jgi:acetolactate synthase-1/2/3 large subunit